MFTISPEIRFWILLDCADLTAMKRFEATPVALAWPEQRPALPKSVSKITEFKLSEPEKARQATFAQTTGRGTFKHASGVDYFVCAAHV